MESLDPYQLKGDIEPKLRKGYVTSKILLARARFIDDASTKTSAFNDPAHFPFFYHLSNEFKPDTVVELGVGLGLRGACLVQGHKVKKYLGQQVPYEGVFYSTRFARANIIDHCKGKINIHHGLITDPDFIDNLSIIEWDLAIISEESTYDRHIEYLDVLWNRVRLGGLIVVDYQDRHEPSKRALDDFCQIKKRDPVIVNTRYGVGMIQR